MIVDLHSHTLFSDGHSNHQEMISSAIEKNISIYGISDHLCFHPNQWTTPVERFAEMRDIFKELKSRTKELKLLFGMEVDYVPGCEPQVVQMKKENQWDYIIGSVHYIGDWNIDSNAKDWIGKDYDATHTEYYRLLTMMVESGLYNIVGHLDLPKKYGTRSLLDFSEMVAKLGKRIKEQGMAYEINTAGRIKACNELYPAKKYVEILFDQGADVTLGSDAHHSNNVGQFFDEAITMLKNVGYTQICYFEKGIKHYLPL